MLSALADGVSKEPNRCKEKCGTADDDEQLNNIVLAQGVQQTADPGVLNQIILETSVQVPDDASHHVDHLSVLEEVLHGSCGTVHHALERHTKCCQHIDARDDHPQDGRDLLELLVADGDVLAVETLDNQRAPIGDGVARKSGFSAQPNQSKEFGEKAFAVVVVGCVVFSLSHNYDPPRLILCVSRVERGITPLQTALAGPQWKVILCPDTLIIALKKYVCQIREFLKILFVKIKCKNINIKIFLS